MKNKEKTQKERRERPPGGPEKEKRQRGLERIKNDRSQGGRHDGNEEDR